MRVFHRTKGGMVSQVIRRLLKAPQGKSFRGWIRRGRHDIQKHSRNDAKEFAGISSDAATKAKVEPMKIIGPKAVNLGRHRRNCTVCAHPKCADIEADFVNWKSAALIADEYGLADRMNVYRHARALELFEKRRRNIRAALEKIIEKAGEVDVNASAVVAAVQAYAKINAQGQWIDRSEHVNLNELFERMTKDELEAYAKDGQLPAWFTQTVGVTAVNGQELKNDE